MVQPLPGLLTASFRGIEFFVPDTSSEVGRRVAEHYFAGMDQSAYDDEGLHAERISIDGLYVGADYISHGKALKEAFEQAGEGTLIHPWWGAINVLLVEPATIKWSAKELRVVRFSANFVKIIENTGSGYNSHHATGPKVFDTARSMAMAARLLANAVGNKTLSRLKSDATTRVGKQFFLGFDGLQGKSGSAIKQLLPQAVPTKPDNFADLFSTLSTNIVDLTRAAAPSAVAPAAGAEVRETVMKTDDGIAFLQNAAERLLDLFATAPSAADQSLNAAAAGDLLAKMATVLTDVAPASRTDAIELRSSVTNVFETLSNALQSLCESAFAGEASTLERAGRATQMAVFADLNETIGRLPQTTRLKIETDADAFAIAHCLYGDDIAAVELYYQDIIKRNHLRHPATVLPGELEVLK